MKPLEVFDGRATSVGGTPIVRVLPTRGRRTVGAWCFVDLMSPGDVLEPDPMEVGPHPHTGLSTVTWLFEGEAVHTDSLGTEQLIRPGQLNLMTAGRGIAHAELGMGNMFLGAQLWIAQPEHTRHSRPMFEHHAELPQVELAGMTATVMAGTFGGAKAATTTDSLLVGADLAVRVGTAEVELDPMFEYAVIPVEGRIRAGGRVLDAGRMAFMAQGAERLEIEAADEDARVLLLGGAPMRESIRMWWNFVARDQAELTEAWRDWRDGNDDRFGPVASKTERVEAPVPPWVRS